MQAIYQKDPGPLKSMSPLLFIIARYNHELWINESI